jgi:hypothetical protein
MRLLKLLGAIIGARGVDLPVDTEYEFDAIDASFNVRTRAIGTRSARALGGPCGPEPSVAGRASRGAPDALAGPPDPDYGSGRDAC